MRGAGVANMNQAHHLSQLSPTYTTYQPTTLQCMASPVHHSALHAPLNQEVVTPTNPGRSQQKVIKL
jgi:hypothetical protein